jgi:hypothetical protein
MVWGDGSYRSFGVNTGGQLTPAAAEDVHRSQRNQRISRGLVGKKRTKTGNANQDHANEHPAKTTL